MHTISISVYINMNIDRKSKETIHIFHPFIENVNEN